MNPFLKNHCLVVLALALLFTVATPLMANETRGTIAWIEPDDFTLTLVDEGNQVLDMRFLVGGQVLLNDREATFWDLEPGDNVHITFDRTNGEMDITKIESYRSQ